MCLKIECLIEFSDATLGWMMVETRHGPFRSVGSVRFSVDHVYFSTLIYNHGIKDYRLTKLG